MTETTDREKLVELAEKTRSTLELHQKRSGVQAEMIRACMKAIRRDPDQVPYGIERARLRKKIREDRAAAWAGLEELCEMLERDAARSNYNAEQNQGDK